MEPYEDLEDAYRAIKDSIDEDGCIDDNSLRAIINRIYLTGFNDKETK